jgi:hypothetical protein
MLSVSRFGKAIGLCVFISLLVTAAGASTASAYEYLVEGKPIGAEEKLATKVTSGTATFVFTVAEEHDLTIECKPTWENTLEASGKGKDGLTLKECKDSGTLAKKCRTPSELKAETLPTELVLLKEKLAEKIGSASQLWFSFPLENNGAETCPSTVKGILNVKGEQTCELSDIESEKTEHAVACTSEGSHFGSTLIGTPTFANSSTFKLTSEKSFGAFLTPFTLSVTPTKFTKSKEIGTLTIKNVTNATHKAELFKINPSKGNGFIITEIPNKCEKTYEAKQECKVEVELTASASGEYISFFEAFIPGSSSEAKVELQGQL